MLQYLLIEETKRDLLLEGESRKRRMSQSTFTSTSTPLDPSTLQTKERWIFHYFKYNTNILKKRYNKSVVNTLTFCLGRILLQRMVTGVNPALLSSSRAILASSWLTNQLHSATGRFGNRYCRILLQLLQTQQRHRARQAKVSVR